LKIGLGYLDTDVQAGARTVLDEGLRGYLDWQLNWH